MPCFTKLLTYWSRSFFLSIDMIEHRKANFYRQPIRFGAITDLSPHTFRRPAHSFQIHENAVYPYKPYQSTARICKGIRPYSCLIGYPGIETSVPVRPWHLAVLSASIGFWTITYTVFVEFSSKIWQKSFWSNIKYCYLTILTIYGLS